MAQLFFGIDASADTMAVCATDELGLVVGETICAATPTTVTGELRALGAGPGSIIGIEAGWCGTVLTRRLRREGFVVRVLSTRYVNGYLKLTQNKTDRNDARGIADIVRLGANAVPDVLVKSEAIQMLRSEVVLRSQLVSQRVALEASIRSIVRLNGGKLTRAYSGTHFDQVIKSEIARLQTEGTDLSEVVGPTAEILVALRRLLERMDRDFVHRANELATCKLFLTIPGVGPICALSFYTAIEDPSRFKRAEDVGPYLGLVPRMSQSGTVLRAGRISRRGSSLTRTHLVTAAVIMMSQAKADSDLKRWALNLEQRAGRGKARVALARKLATIMIAMWKSGEPFRPDAIPG